VSDEPDEKLADEKKAQAIAAGKGIMKCWELTWQWWEIHDPAALHAPFRRDVARVIRLRDYVDKVNTE
jgi:hypothetical protein